MDVPSRRAKRTLVVAGSALVILGLAPFKVYGMDSLEAAGGGLGLLVALVILILGCGLGGGILFAGLSFLESRARTAFAALGVLFLATLVVALLLFSWLDDYVKTDGGPSPEFAPQVEQRPWNPDR